MMMHIHFIGISVNGKRIMDLNPLIKFGTAVLYRSSIRVEPHVTQGFSSFEQLDCLFVTCKSVRLVVVYRPPNNHGCSMHDFFSEFSDLLEMLCTCSGHILIVGDFNFHMNDDNDHYANEMRLLLMSFGLQQHVNQHTHRNGHILDLVITRVKDSFVMSAIAEDHGFPDHYPVLIDTSFKKPGVPQRTVTYRRIKGVDMDSFRHEISESRLGQPDSGLSLAEYVSLTTR